MAKNYLKRLIDLDKKMKIKYSGDVVRFVKPDNEKFLVEASNLRSEIGKHLTESELSIYENSITFIDDLTE